jgi:hypothetical protein
VATATIIRSLTFAGAIAAVPPAWLEGVIRHDEYNSSTRPLEQSQMSRKPRMHIALSTDAVVAMSVAGVITAVIAALLAMMVQAPQSPFGAEQTPAAVAASSI